jgi:hypothetical protein
MSIAHLRRDRRLSPEFHAWLRLVMPPQSHPETTREKRREAQRRYNARHRKLINARMRVWRAANRARNKAIKAAHYQRHREQIKAKSRAYYAAHRAEQIAKAIARKRRNTPKGAVSVLKVRRERTPAAIELLRKPARTGLPPRSFLVEADVSGR